LTGGLAVPAFLFGGDGNDTLDAGGGTANNVLVGGAGADVLTGGSGSDGDGSGSGVYNLGGFDFDVLTRIFKDHASTSSDDSFDLF